MTSNEPTEHREIPSLSQQSAPSILGSSQESRETTAVNEQSQPNESTHSVASASQLSQASDVSISSTPLQSQQAMSRKRRQPSLESTTRRRTRSAGGLPSVGPSSIRDTARVMSRSAGSQSSVSSTTSSYHPEYHREQRRQLQLSQSQSNDEDAVMDLYHSTQNPPDSPTVFTGPTPPSQQEPILNDGAAQAEPPHPPINEASCRICVCDMPSIPSECTNSNSETLTRCNFHKVRQCDDEQCSKTFHKHCLRGLGWLDSDEYLCMECSTQIPADDTPYNSLGGTPGSRKEMLLRLGMTYPDDESRRDAAIRLMKKRIGVMEAEMLPDDVESILNNAPKAYPSAVRMSEESMDKHIRCGRDFEISVQLHRVNRCDCCGRVQPGHIDPAFPNSGNIPFQKDHLTMKYHPAWKCECDYCKGGQFYSPSRPTVMNKYKAHHNALPPWEFLQLNRHEPNAFICDNCHKEVGSKDVDGEIYFVFTFHCRNST